MDFVNPRGLVAQLGLLEAIVVLEVLIVSRSFDLGLIGSLELLGELSA